jgi:hypothetical protein
MSTDDDTQPAVRLGTYADLSRRMDRMDQRQDNVEAQVRDLATTVARVESNMNHSAEVSKLHFESIENGQRLLSSQLTDFVRRTEGIISGEIETAQTRAGREMVTDYIEWRKTVDAELRRLSEREQGEDARAAERSRIAGVTNRTLAAVILVANFLLALVVVIVNWVSP